MKLPRLQAVLLAGACCVWAQSKKPEDLAQGKILVTPRSAPDPLFAESVILLVQYSQDTAVGLMLNHRSTVPVSRVLRETPSAAKHSEPIFVGGPVELDTVMAVARAAKQPDGAAAVLGDLYLIMAKPALEKALGTRDANGLRIYLGYCGWGPHQLANEVRLGGWYIFDNGKDLAFDSDPATLWTRMIEKTELQIVRLGFIPPFHQ